MAETRRTVCPTCGTYGYIPPEPKQYDRDDSYPDYGPEDDAAAGMGLPSMTAGTLPRSGPRWTGVARP